MRLAVTADDFGLDAEVNRGIVELARQGRISSASVMLHRDSSLEGLEALVATGIAIGAHLVLVEELPLAIGAPAHGLLDAQGRLPANWRKLFTGLMFRPHWADALRKEAESQLGRFRELGLCLRFINSHQHVHLFPPLWRALQPVFAQDPSVFLRCANAMRPGWGKQSMLDMSGAISCWLAAPTNPTIYPLGIDAAGQLGRANARTVLARIPSIALRGVAPELVVHPGREPVANRDRYAHWRYQWESEFEFLSSDEFSNMLRQQDLAIGFPK